jgi:adenine-specific DNA-methyltransferase
MVYTPYHSKYWATALTLRGAGDDLSRLSQSIASARVDLNPHQVDAALAALRSPLSKGMILADEVGLGKTIEAALVIAQRWAERRRRILLILPATLRKQWQQELLEKFSLPCLILENDGAVEKWLSREKASSRFSTVTRTRNFHMNRTSPWKRRPRNYYLNRSAPTR